MNEALKEEIALSKVRNLGMDVQATIHMKEAYTYNRLWTCECVGCEYLRKSPPVMEAIRRAVLKSLGK